MVEVSFDLNEKKRKRSRKPSNRSHRVSPKEDYDKDDNDSDDDDDDDDLSMLFGKLVKTPYLHYLFNSRIDYPINNSVLNEKYKTIVVKNPSQFKHFYGHEQRIFASGDGTILFCGCHLFPAFDIILQSNLQPKYENEHSLESDLELDMDLPLFHIEARRELNKTPHWPDYDEEPLEYEFPNKLFKRLLRFMGPCGAKNPKATQVTNFEIFIKEDPPIDPHEEVCEPESFKVGNITFYKCKPTCVQELIDEKKRRLKERLLMDNFDKRDDWSNLNKVSHRLGRVNCSVGPNEIMVLPELVINCKYYSTHVIFESIEPLRRSEFLPPPFDNPFSFKRMEHNDVVNYKRYPCDGWTAMVKDGQIFIESEALDGFYRSESWDTFYEYIDTKIVPTLEPILPNMFNIIVNISECGLAYGFI